ESDWQETLEAIAQTHARWGQIQEVILQPHSPGNQQSWTGKSFDPDRLLEVVAIARRLLPPDIALQIPPNLVSEATLLACLREGASDIGGISPKDEVNPDYPHPHDRHLAAQLDRAGWQLRPRLPVYPQYDTWLSSRLQAAIAIWREKLTGDRTAS
ncbi:MAG: 7,8-didemethyl-8-hydroxy-5-deazariboflavin synthase subunit CofG, partial [Microcoleus sp. SIO2G3]|nr:7,8-didemethyl-8-hydroxy-5-deazariboflavin synthase subunit CofG [Microcoleus sp. SIO2G3]